jgi:hypothetical protein
MGMNQKRFHRQASQESHQLYNGTEIPETIAEAPALANGFVRGINPAADNTLAITSLAGKV